MKKLHVIFLDFDEIKNPLLGGGQARATFEVGKRLVQKGHTVTVVCSRYPGYRDRTEEGIQYRHIGLGAKNVQINNAFYILSLPFVVPFLKADVILECFTAPISTLFSPLFTKIPVVGLSTSFEAERFAKKYHLPFDVIEKIGMRCYKYFISLTEYFAEKIKNANPDIVTKVIPEGVEEQYFTFKSTKPKHILFLGRLDIGQKGIDLLLEAYAKIAKKAKYPLIIAGNGPDEEKVKQLIKQYKLEKSVQMIGYTSGEKKEKYMSEALYVAISSRNETFSCFALEALAAGLPLIAFDIPGLSWTDNSVVLKTPAFDTNAYAKLLLTSMDERKMRTLGKQTKKFAKGFTWGSVAEEFETFFTQIVGGTYEK